MYIDGRFNKGLKPNFCLQRLAELWTGYTAQCAHPHELLVNLLFFNCEIKKMRCFFEFVNQF